MSARRFQLLLRYQQAIDKLWKKHVGDDRKKDKAEARIRRTWKKNIIRAYCMSFCDSLKKKYPRLRQGARALKIGVDRSTLSRWERGEITARRDKQNFLSLAQEHKIVFPPWHEIQRRATVLTVTFVQNDVLNNEDETEDLTREGFEFLIETLLSDRWHIAHKNDSIRELKEAFESVSKDVHPSPWVETQRVRDYGLMEHIHETWLLAFLLSMDVLEYFDD